MQCNAMQCNAFASASERGCAMPCNANAPQCKCSATQRDAMQKQGDATQCECECKCERACERTPV
eukprot:106093-Lingulodinium_polyedra.AAC.1